MLEGAQIAAGRSGDELGRISRIHGVCDLQHLNRPHCVCRLPHGLPIGGQGELKGLNARASVRATLLEIDALTMASVLPGVEEDYPGTPRFLECYTAQLGMNYVNMH